MTEERRQVTVVGMHRSGTSATAGAFCELSGWAGDAEHMVATSEFNPKGYVERVDTGQALDRILEQLGGTWDAPPVTTLDRQSLEPHRAALQQVFDDVAQGAPEGTVPVVKDPRLSLFAAALPAVLGSTDGIVVCVRHPLSVARSLRRSEGVALSTGLALWEQYNAAICTGLAGRPVRVRAYGPEAPQQVSLSAFAAEVLDRLGAGPSQPASHEWWSPDLVHESADPHEDREWLTLAQHQLWEMLRANAGSARPTVLPGVELSASGGEELDRAVAQGRTDTAREQQAHEIAQFLEVQASREQDVARLAQAVSHVQAEVRDLAGQRDALAAHVEQERAARAALGQDLSEAVSRLESSAQVVSRLTEALRVQSLELASACEQATALGRERDAVIASLAETQARSNAAEHELARVREHRDAVVQDHLAVMGSRSWRLGHGLSWPSRALRRGPRP